MKRSDKTKIAYLRRDLRTACLLLDKAAADLSTCVRAADDGRPIEPSDLRQRSSEYARWASDLTPRRGAP